MGNLGNLSIWLVFILGIIVGGVLFSKDFRQRFFTGFRRFLSGVGKSSGKTRASSRSIYKQRNEYEPAPKYTPKPKVIDCPTCDGIGKVEEELPPLMKEAPGIREKWVTCPTCEGSGKVYAK